MVAALCAFLTGLTPAAAQWQPTRPIEFVIMAGEGGGADRIVRNMIEIIGNHRLAPVPMIPVNIPGNSGADALVHLKERTGDNHVLLFTLNSFYTTPI